MMKLTVPLFSPHSGTLLIPAEQVTDVLRNLAADWLHATEDRVEAVLDAETVCVLAAVLTDLADQIDVECIAFASTSDEEEA
jgi:hypothetical protein